MVELEGTSLQLLLCPLLIHPLSLVSINFFYPDFLSSPLFHRLVLFLTLNLGQTRYRQWIQMNMAYPRPRTGTKTVYHKMV